MWGYDIFFRLNILCFIVTHLLQLDDILLFVLLHKMFQKICGHKAKPTTQRIHNLFLHNFFLAAHLQVEQYLHRSASEPGREVE